MVGACLLLMSCSLPLGNVSRRFPFLSQIRHRFRVAIVLFHDGIVAAATPAMSHRLMMLRPRFHLISLITEATHPGFSVLDFAEANRYTIPACLCNCAKIEQFARRPRFVDGRGRPSERALE